MTDVLEILMIVVTSIGMVGIAAAVAWYLMCHPRWYR